MNFLEFFFVISGIVILIIGFDIAKKQKFNALHFLVFLGVGVGLLVFTFFPNILQKIGDIFGVARGADVLVYASIIFLLYFSLLLLTKYLDNKEEMTRLIRELAIERSNKLNIDGKIVFVMPAFNEGKILIETIQKIQKSGYNNILVINDGSNDGSRNMLEKQKGIITLHHSINRGQGAALETGFEYIRRYGNVDYIITFDADGQHDIKNVKDFESILDSDNEIDILLGSRFLGKTQSNIPLSRKIVLKLGMLFTFFVSQINLTDTHNGYRAIRKRALDTIRITQDGMSHASEIIDIVASKKLKYKEIPVTIKYTEYSLSKGQSSGNAINIAMRILWSKFFK